MHSKSIGYEWLMDDLLVSNCTKFVIKTCQSKSVFQMWRDKGNPPTISQRMMVITWNKRFVWRHLFAPGNCLFLDLRPSAVTNYSARMQNDIQSPSNVWRCWGSTNRVSVSLNEIVGRYLNHSPFHDKTKTVLISCLKMYASVCKNGGPIS